MSDGEQLLDTEVADGVVVEIRLRPTVRAPFVARRLVGSLISSGPRLRALDASLLASEITTLVLPLDRTIILTVIESGRSVRASVKVDSKTPDNPDTIAVALLNRVADRWSLDGDLLWFEVDLIRRQDLSSLSDLELFELLPADRDARDELFERYAGFAASISRRYRTRDHRTEDLEQVGMLGLVRALERFDPAVGVKFTSFAGPWIAGVVKRHLRDHGWSMRVPRSLKDGSLAVRRARDELSQSLGHDPNIEEIAEALDVSPEEVRQAIQAGDAYSLTSLDAPLGNDDGQNVGDLMGGLDPDLAMAEDWPAIEAVLEHLSDREQQILYLRYFEDLTQSEIAPIVGVSQVHVSRLLTKSLEKVRSLLDDPH
ncbi:MAG: SigB/SigF/SigG family RNA polymerase sigma factor [Acidimicrobiia bacterium]